jgi:hypothetical protein
MFLFLSRNLLWRSMWLAPSLSVSFMRLILSLLLLFPFISQAQEVLFEEAVLINRSGDTLKGKIRWNKESSRAKSVCFMQTGAAVAKDFTPGDIRALFIANNSAWYEPITYTWKENNQEFKVTRIAKIICKGYASLYKLDLSREEYDYRDEFSFVYILKIGDKDFVLHHSTSRLSSKFNRYTGMLRYALKDVAIPESKFNALQYHEKYIIPLLIDYNTGKSQPATIIYKPKNKFLLAHQLKAGGIFSPTVLTRREYKLNNGTGYSIGYSLDIANLDISKHFFTTADLSVFHLRWPKSTYENVKEGDDFAKRITGGQLAGLVTYRFTYNKVTPLLHLGLTAELSNSVQQFICYFNLGAGIKIRRFNARLQYERPMSIRIKAGEGDLVQLKVGYAFLEHKFKH